MTTELQQNRYDQLVRRVGGLIGPGSKVSEVLAELFPMIDVENVPPELRVLGGTALAFRSTAITAGAGDENASQLENPVGSNVLITVTSIIVTVTTASSVNMTLAAAQLANTNGFGQFRDPRAAASGGGAAVGNTRIETGLLINPGARVVVAGNTPFVVTDPDGICVLPPDSRFTVGIPSLQQTLTVAYFWRERVAEESELNL